MDLKNKKNYILVSLVIMTLMLMSTIQINIIADDSRNVDTGVNSSKITAADFVITAGVNDLVANTPIILKATDFPLPYSKLPTAIIYDGATALPTQADDLNGDGVVDEIVFQLQADILATNSKTFSLKVMNEGKTNGQAASSIKIAKGEYNATYQDWLPAAQTSTFMNGSSLSGMVDEVGEVVWIDTDWGTMSLYVSAGWRQSAFKHIYMKDQGWDLVMSGWNASADWQWQWAKFAYEADFGWHNGDFADTVSISKVGPVRGVVQTISGIGYNGRFGSADGLNASRTFTFYNGMPGIATNLRLVGPDAVAASEDMNALYGGPLEFASKYVDYGMNTSATPWTAMPGTHGFDSIYSPGGPNLGANQSRYQPTSSNRNLNLSLLTAPYFGMFNGSGYGFGVYWGNFDYQSMLTSIDWSDGEIDVKYAFDKFPLAGINRLLLPFSNAADPNATLDYLVGNWTASFGLNFTSYLRDPWIVTVTETETEVSVSVSVSVSTYETTIVETYISNKTEVSVSVSVSVSKEVSVSVTTKTVSTPGFGILATIFVISGLSIYIKRKRQR